MRLSAIKYQFVILILLALSFSCITIVNNTKFKFIFNGKDLEWRNIGVL
ncbi:hypothetical protein SAMN04487987_10832 [Algibacter pectinivorans]|uniref:Lipoprotein n=1 Tax=Algibacter pectinivorans TaxID=870482 RepID=A0A1I1QZQ2_9FLAO|nr:hypothetical protein SAMN04487987_10832 [Algibacter pectinivorans]